MNGKSEQKQRMMGGTDMATCKNCLHLPLCMYIAHIDEKFRFPEDGENCDMFDEDKEASDYELLLN